MPVLGRSILTPPSLVSYLDSVLHFQPPNDDFYLVPYRKRGRPQLPSNLLVGQSLGYQFRDLLFLGGKLVHSTFLSDLKAPEALVAWGRCEAGRAAKTFPGYPEGAFCASAVAAPPQDATLVLE